MSYAEVIGNKSSGAGYCRVDLNRQSWYDKNTLQGIPKTGNLLSRTLKRNISAELESLRTQSSLYLRRNGESRSFQD